MKTTSAMETVTAVTVVQAVMAISLMAGFAFGMLTGDAALSALSMAWLAVCGWLVAYGPVMAVGLVLTSLFLRGAR